MKKKYLITFIGFLCCLYAFSFTDNNLTEPIQFEGVTVTSYCIEENDSLSYVYSFEIDLCSIDTPNGNPSNFHAYIIDTSSNSWVYLGEPTITDGNNLIYEVVDNVYNTPLNEYLWTATWRITGFYDYVDPTTIDTTYTQLYSCTNILSFIMPPFNYGCLECDNLPGLTEVFTDSEEMCNSSLNFQVSYNNTEYIIHPEFTWNYGDSVLNEVTDGILESNGGLETTITAQTNYTYPSNGAYTVSVSYDVETISTGDICKITRHFDIQVTDCTSPPNPCDCFTIGTLNTTSLDMCTKQFSIGSASVSWCVTRIPEYTWDFGDGTIIVTQGRPVNHTYTANGTYTATVSFGVQSIATGEICIKSTSTEVVVTGCEEICDLTSNISVFDASVKMCEASFNMTANYDPAVVTLIPGTVTIDYGDNTPNVVGNFIPGPNPSGYFGWYTNHTYATNETYTVTFSFNTQSITTGYICTTTETIEVEIKDCVGKCTDEPYIEPHWELCETNNVCKLKSWPIRVLDDDGSPLLLIDGYSFSWLENGTEVSTSDIFYGAQEDVTYTVIVTYPNGCEYTTTYMEDCCDAKDIVITADGNDISDTLTYTIPCADTCVDISATNLTSVEYNSNDPVFSNLNGVFCLSSVAIENFTVTITGKDSCGDPYTQNVTVFIEQDCCLDDVSVIFDECPKKELKHLYEYDPHSKVSQISKASNLKADCDPCDAGVIAVTIVDTNENEITNYETINISWDLNPNGIDLSETQFLVNVDVFYTATVTVLDLDGNSCIYTYDFIYNCKTKDCNAIETPTNLQTNGSSLSWDSVPGAISYIVSSPGIIKIKCCDSSSVSIASIQTTNTSLELSEGLQSKCFVWQVTAVCSDGSESDLSEQACHLRIGKKLASKDKVSINPNPNNGTMNIKLELEDDSNITLKVYRFDGALVKTIQNFKTFQGQLKTNLNVNLTSGLYFFKFEYLDKIITKKVHIN